MKVNNLDNRNGKKQPTFSHFITFINYICFLRREILRFKIQWTINDFIKD